MADVNNDGRLDVIIAYYLNNRVGVLLGFDNRTFSAPITYLSDTRPKSVAVGDLDGDSYLDMIVANNGANSISIFFGYGDGSFHEQVVLETGWFPSSAMMLDWNDDGHMDIIVSHDGDQNIVPLIGDGTGNFTNQVIYAGRLGNVMLVAADLNSDDHLDIIAYDMLDVILIRVLRNATDSHKVHSSSHPVLTSQPLVVADLNNDSYPDIIAVEYFNNWISIQFGQGNGTFTDLVYHPAGTFPVAVSVSDMNQDSLLDIVVVNQGSNNIAVLLGQGDGTFRNASFFSTGSRPRNLIIHDFTDDHRLDVLVTNYWERTTGVLYGQPDFAFLQIDTLTMGGALGPSSLAVADFNNDTHPDLAVTLSGNNTVSVLLGHGDRSFSPPSLYPLNISSPSSSSMWAGDVNGDGHIDAAATYPELDQVFIFFGDGRGSFSHHQTLSTGAGSSPSYVRVRDVNNDGIDDVVVSNLHRHNIAIFLGNRGGVLDDAVSVQLAFDSAPFVVVVSDVNGDLRNDLIVGNDGSDSVTVSLQDC